MIKAKPATVSAIPAVNPVIGVSIIIPCINEAVTIVEALQALQPLRKKGCEILLVDGGSSDSTVELSRPLVDKLIHAEPGRARQMNVAAVEAQGLWLLFLHADTRLPTKLLPLLTLLKTTGQHWGFFCLRLSGRQRIFRLIERAINIRSYITRVATGDQSIFVRRTVFSQMGGFDDIPLMEDVALSKRLRKLSLPVYWSQPVVTSSRRWQQQGIVKTMVLMWSLRLAYFLGVSPQRLLRFYYAKS